MGNLYDQYQIASNQITNVVAFAIDQPADTTSTSSRSARPNSPAKTGMVVGEIRYDGIRYSLKNRKM